jgi:eukaryotic-like serine/threonine-protein kinase
MATSSEDHFDGGARFSLERPLGEGGYGIVYRAFDHQRGHPVALKMLRHPTPDAIYRIKREFRSLSDLSHPNLVSLYDLLVSGGHWFFTMELIDDACDFLKFCQRDVMPIPPLPVDDTISMVRHDDESTVRREQIWNEERILSLRQALGQLAEGLSALHRAGKLHRDIKPSNVVVTTGSRVVLLDFGLVTELDFSKNRSEVVAGTPAYMSPEQCESLPLSEASDWYSAGVMLYQVLTGRLPFDGRFHDILHKKLTASPLPIRDYATGVPGDLEGLCLRLLDPAAAQRPGAAEVFKVARDWTAKAVQLDITRSREALFVGRKEQLDRLRKAFQTSQSGRLAAVFISGASGIGKTALVQHFLDELRDEPDTIVLSARCYERESVPYKAIDGLIDSLSRHLRQMPREEAETYLPRDVAVLARLFPVLHRVPSVAALPTRSGESPDSVELRHRAFAAMKALLARLAARKKVILFVDDLHCGDVDSGLILRALLREQDPPNMLMIGAFRADDWENSPILNSISGVEWNPRNYIDRLNLEQLPAEEALELAMVISGDRDRAAEVAEDSGGNPLFICELVDYGLRSEASAKIRTLDDVIRVRLSRLPPAGITLARIIAVAGRPLDTNVAFEAANVEPDTQLLSILRSENLIRHRPASDREQVEIFHDRVRATILEQLDAAALRTCHYALARALEHSSGADPEALAQHYLSAGERQLAARYSATAAERSSNALAFERAASLYRLAIDVTDPDDDSLGVLYQKLGDALANTGRGAEAADAYLKGVPFGGIELFLDSHRKAAEQLFRSGHFDRALEVLKIVLGRLKMPLARTGRGAIIALLLRRLRLRIRGLQFHERELSEIDADDVLRIDTCWPVALGLMTVDTIRGADFQTRHLFLALRAGEPYRIVRALAMEVAYSSASGGRGRERTEAVSQMTMALAKRINHPHALGLAILTSGIAAFCEGRWRKAYELCSEAEEIFRQRCTGVSWERDNAQLFSVGSLFFLGEIKELSRRLPLLIREADDRGDLYAQANLRIGFGLSHFVWLAADDPDRGEAELNAALSAWPLAQYNLQQFWERGGQIDIALYRGDDMSSWARIPTRWRSMSRSFVRHIQILLLVALFSRARRMIAAAQTAADPRSLFDAALADALRIEREQMSWALPWASMIRASIAFHEGDRKKALAFLASAESGLEAQDMTLYAAVVKRRRGLLLGEAGKELVEAAEVRMAQQAIKRPDRIEAVLLPGVWDPQ